MKTNLMLIVCTLFYLSCSAQNLKALDDKYGFRAAKLEMSPSSFPNLKLTASDMDDFPNTKTYVCTNIDKQIGDFTIDEITYWFYKEQLYTIEITVSSGYSNQQGVLKVLEAAYGKGDFRKSSFGSDEYVWHGARVNMIYTLGDKIDPTGDIQFTCKKIESMLRDNRNLIKRQEDQNILKAAKKL
jgi:hypothetical protein